MIDRISSLTLEQQQQQLEIRQNLQFFTGDGYLDFYAFSFVLFESIWLDGFDIKEPNQIIDLLGDFLYMVASGEYPEFTIEEDHIIEKTINNMSSREFQLMYPEGKTLMLHPSIILTVIHEFISAIGHNVLNIESNSEDLYSYWIKKENIYTFAYFDRFFRQFTKLVSKVGDFKERLINLHLSTKHSINHVDIESILGEKEGRYNEMKDRIDAAISQKFYLEAIVLEESSISDRLAMALFVQGVKAGSKNFSDLINQCANDLPRDLREELHQWRKNRNKMVHGMVRSSPLEKLIDIETLDQLTEQTAIQGMELNNTVNAWFEDLIIYEMNPYCFRVPNVKVIIQ